jgi:hypothetical protein
MGIASWAKVRGESILNSGSACLLKVRLSTPPAPARHCGEALIGHFSIGAEANSEPIQKANEKGGKAHRRLWPVGKTLAETRYPAYFKHNKWICALR